MGVKLCVRIRHGSLYFDELKWKNGNYTDAVPTERGVYMRAVSTKISFLRNGVCACVPFLPRYRSYGTEGDKVNEQKLLEIFIFVETGNQISFYDSGRSRPYAISSLSPKINHYCGAGERF
jgi:hypothetical protein